MGGAYFTKERIYDMLAVEPAIVTFEEGVQFTSFRDTVTGAIVVVKGEFTIDKLVEEVRQERKDNGIEKMDNLAKDVSKIAANTESLYRLRNKITTLENLLSSAQKMVESIKQHAEQA